MSHYERWGKRCFDIIASATAIILLAAFLLLIAVLVRIGLGSPILFRQERSGRNQRPFTILKFRTMTDERDAAGNRLSDTQRLTRLGRILRSTSRDELPELFNVLWGDMSLVGPRPLVTRYDPWYRPEEMRRFEASLRTCASRTSSDEPPRTSNAGMVIAFAASIIAVSSSLWSCANERSPFTRRGSQCQRQRPSGCSRRFLRKPSCERGRLRCGR